ncbi:beta-lysine acetyltransferase [Mariniphaga anaerophila]|uniref:Beta-lysine acetyltransferase n=1 Tax=Mariniphaga anaerophila TaxID=1484053 RepID=A0A1M5A8D5_9BACT|nr:putative beta-lysine N-acetyltransferase [Mariniphaga anaerophila]SHF26560.1 beta-lysine acetyltransferase [Mariniphaga anaerophila]
MADRIRKIGNSTIQYGEFNNRVFLLKYDSSDSEAVLPELEQLAKEGGYSKIVTKIHAEDLPVFILKGYKVEAYVPKFYNGKGDCVLASRFFDKNREDAPAELMNVFSGILNSANSSDDKKVLNGYELRQLQEEDAGVISKVLESVFDTYPFPVENPEYILKTMREESALYFGVWDDKKLIGISNAEVDFNRGNAEMTDFAVIPEYRGKNLALHLLNFMEKEIKLKGIKTAYTIARLAEPGMNKTFLNAGYRYSGTLVNNTNIAGKIESMNIFYKHL